MRSWAWWKLRIAETVVAIVLATCLIAVAGVVADRQRTAVPASAWLRVNEIYVPDHPVGSNPAMIYDRIVGEEFEGFWIVEVQRQTYTGLWTTTCSGSGVSNYSPGKIIENNTVSWGWFVGEKCPVPPGLYRLRITYTLSKPGWPPKRVFVLSNEFKVEA